MYRARRRIAILAIFAENRKKYMYFEETAFGTPHASQNSSIEMFVVCIYTIIVA